MMTSSDSLVRLTGNRAAAEDAFQDTFLQVHLSADTFDATRRFKPWLFTIAANKARDALRKTTRRRTLDLSAPIAGGAHGSDGDRRTYVDLMEVDVDPPGAALDIQERDKRVQHVLDQLPYASGKFWCSPIFQRLSYNQIADSLQIPLGLSSPGCTPQSLRSRGNGRLSRRNRPVHELQSQRPS